MDTYRELLGNIRDHLQGFGVPAWPARLDQWIRELDSIDTDRVQAHLLRTQKALGGMGSIADVVICPQAGHNIADDKNVIKTANDRLLSLVERLYAEITRMLAMRAD